ncbi:PQQ-dependent sugar dehydrogenase, partial [Phytoactinopolyspora endophytica]|uniref:PQQ-dependent sugar dehydrogenase n=1 Tax=Phytoactinopolyspora endophytica TaxID=1642495 RepID=UPI0013EDD03F
MATKKHTAAPVAAALTAALLAACTSADEETNRATPETSEEASDEERATTAESTESTESTQNTEIADITEITTDITTPWGLAFLPDGTALVSSRDTYELRRVDPATGEHESVGTVEGSQAAGDSGLMGLAASPEIAEDRTVFAYVTVGEVNQVVALEFDADFGSFEQTRVVLDGIPAGGSRHNGGRITIGPDGALWITTGDAGEPSRAPDPDSLNGKILRVLPDGGIPDDNPGDGPIFSSGHRNVQGITFGPDGTVYASEFGENTEDEVNVLLPG